MIHLNNKSQKHLLRTPSKILVLKRMKVSKKRRRKRKKRRKQKVRKLRKGKSKNKKMLKKYLNKWECSIKEDRIRNKDKSKNGRKSLASMKISLIMKRSLGNILVGLVL